MANQWVRLWVDMANDPKWRTIARASKQSIASVIAVYIHLLTSAANANERGRTQVNDEDIASALDMEIEAIAAIREAMQGRVMDGETLSGWDKRQPAREDNSAERSKAWREQKKAEQQAERNRTQTNANERQIREEEIREEKEEERQKKSAGAAKFSPEDMSIAELILDGVKTVAPSAAPEISKWAATIRLMRERDGRTHDQIMAMFAWANTHSFWRTNILSPEKLREKWVTLEAQRNEKNLPRAGPTPNRGDKRQAVWDQLNGGSNGRTGTTERVIDGKAERVD